MRVHHGSPRYRSTISISMMIAYQVSAQIMVGSVFDRSSLNHISRTNHPEVTHRILYKVRGDMHLWWKILTAVRVQVRLFMMTHVSYRFNTYVYLHIHSIHISNCLAEHTCSSSLCMCSGHRSEVWVLCMRMREAIGCPGKISLNYLVIPWYVHPDEATVDVCIVDQ